jgi:dolichol-phosphate mannosyltransferase
LISPIDIQNTAVVIPTYNERDNIAKIIDALLRLYPAIHILVVDDHSPDGTAGIVREMQGRCPNLILLERMQNRGFAPSYRDGFRRILPEPWCQAVVTMDADFSHDPAAIAKLLAGLEAVEVVVGSRYTMGGSVRNWNLRRRLLSRAANYYVRAVLSFGVRDMTSGFVGMRREALERAGVEHTGSEGYAFLVELKYLLARSGSRIAEHAISFDERREGQSKMSAGKVWEALWMPWRIRLRWKGAGVVRADKS